jgi:hypothetical protein
VRDITVWVTIQVDDAVDLREAQGNIEEGLTVRQEGSLECVKELSPLA